MIAMEHPDCGEILIESGGVNDGPIFPPDDLWAAEQQLYRAVELQASLKRRRGLAAWLYRGEHRPRETSFTVEELREEWEIADRARRIAHRRSLLRPYDPSPVYLGSHELSIRFVGIAPHEDTEPYATLEMVGDEPVLSLAALTGPNPGYAPQLEWTEDGKLLADGKEIELAPPPHACGPECLQQFNQRLAALDAAGEILESGDMW